MNTERAHSVWRWFSPLSVAGRLHRDERGSLSVMGVFAIFFLTVLLGMIFNVGRQVDDKLRMQNAADAAAYSGTLTVSRGMNAIAYSNHLLCEIFALTAYMREARLDPNSRALPDWDDELLAKYPRTTPPQEPNDLEKHAIEYHNNLRMTNPATQGQPPLRYLVDPKTGKPLPMAGDVLDVWEKVAQQAFVELGSKAFGDSGAKVESLYDRFVNLGEALVLKIRLERNMLDTFEPMAREHSRLTLSVFEYILGGTGPFPVDYPPPQDQGQNRATPGPQLDPRRDRPGNGFQGGLISQFQRSVVYATPEMAQRVAQELAERHGEGTQSQHRGRQLTAVLYRTDASRFDGSPIREDDRDARLLPVINPNELNGDLFGCQTFDPQLFPNYSSLTVDQLYFKIAYETRTRLAKHYLEEWIYHWMDRYFTQRHRERRSQNSQGPYGRDVASLSQLANFWRIFTCGHLDRLLNEEFPKSNLPFVIRVKNRQNWSFANIEPRFLPDQQALEREYHCVAVVAWPHTRQFGPGIYRNPLNGDNRSAADDTYAMTFAQAKFFLPRARYRCCPWGRWVRVGGAIPNRQYIPYYDNWPRDWSTFNQNWRTKLVPTWTDQLPAILTQHPGGSVNDLSTPNMGNLTLRDLHLLNSH